jgi:hypothetical protein
MYCRLLEDAVHDLKNEKPARRPARASPSIEIGITGTIPKGYIPSELRRLEAYRRRARTIEDIEKGPRRSRGRRTASPPRRCSSGTVPWRRNSRALTIAM